MALLKRAGLGRCFNVGWHCRRIDNAIGFRRFPEAADQLDWRSDSAVSFAVGVATNVLADLLESFVLSIPVSRRLERLKAVPLNARTMVGELCHRLMSIDLRGSPERARWLLAGWQLQPLELLDEARSEERLRALGISDVSASYSKIIRNGATALTPHAAEKTTRQLKRIRKQYGSRWFSILAECASDHAITASSKQMEAEDTSIMACAWAPLRVFLSHSSLDKEIVRRIDERLRARVTIDAFLDERDLRIGAELNPVLEAAIAESDFVLAIGSVSSFASHWFMKELRFAKRRRVPVVPLRVDDAPVPHALTGILQGDIRPDFDTAIERVILSITGNPAVAFVGGRQLPAVRASLRVVQSTASGKGGKLADLTLNLITKKDRVAKSLSLTTLAQWDMEQPGALTTTERISEPEGLAAHIRVARGSRAVVPMSIAVKSNEPAVLTCTLFTRHDRGNGLGRYVFLLGAELTFDEPPSLNLGGILVDLHGQLVLGHTQGYGSNEEHERAGEIAEEILRVTPPSCAADVVLLQNLRDAAGYSEQTWQTPQPISEPDVARSAKMSRVRRKRPRASERNTH